MIEKKELLLFDNCLAGYCNMSCRYCRTKSSADGGNRGTAAGNLNNGLKRSSQTLVEITNLAVRIFDISILKVSGYGELLALPDAVKILKGFSNDYERIQLITNGIMLNESIISNLAEIRNINICVSLDGHSPDLNRCRTSDKKIISRILKNIELLQKHKIQVEINSVLTLYNIKEYFRFVEFLADNYDPLICYPFPVRGADELSAFGSVHAEELMPLLDSGNCMNIMPHKAYVQRLISFVSKGRREDKCYVGYANLGIDPSGDLLVCACNVKQSIGNVITQDPTEIMKSRMSHPLFYKFHFPQILFEGCRGCFTHNEIINLFLDGTISLKDIGRIPLFESRGVQDRLKQIRERIDSP